MHAVMLGEEADMQNIVDAIAKVWENRAELVPPQNKRKRRRPHRGS
jgi:hypothetical protein